MQEINFPHLPESSIGISMSKPVAIVHFIFEALEALMKKHLPIALPIAGVAILLAIGGLTHAEEIVVVESGHAGPLSGPSTHHGKDRENGVRLATEDPNTQGILILIGGKKAHFESLGADDAADKPGAMRRWRPSPMPPRSHSILARMDQLVNCHHQSNKNDADSPKRIVK
ncbi:hypothetical protein [Verminephrobacter eiseniae]|uniref:hypothetical protein n=1 Tax=Verminephrobacter eiseniae TaxID=364317 RepID=UPI00223794E1|nr:hypothetical protein [Verminephrobacter eiseniae]